MGRGVRYEINWGGGGIVLQNFKIQNVELQNAEFLNVELQNAELQNVKLQNVENYKTLNLTERPNSKHRKYN